MNKPRHTMSVLRSLSIAMLAVLASSCCMLPKWLGGRETCQLSIPNFEAPTASPVKYTLCASDGGETSLGIIDLRLKEYGDARVHFEAAVQQTSRKDSNALFLLGVTVETLGLPNDAAGLYKEAIDLGTTPIYEESYRRVRGN